MKIAHIGSRGFPGFNSGVEKSLEEICPRLASKGHQVMLYCSEDVTTPEPVYKSTVLKRTPAVHTKHFETISRVAFSALDALSEDYDIVHYHSIGPALLSWVSRFGKNKTVVTVHGLDWQRSKWGAFAKWCLQMGEKCSVFFPNHTIVVSKHLKRYYENLYHKEVSFIPNGVSILDPLPAKQIHEKWFLDPKEYILFASRLVPEKECHTLIQAFKQVKTDKKLVIAGSNWHSEKYEMDLKKLAEEDPRIIFVGWAVGELLQELFSNAYLYCLPSQIEGLSLSLLEAMSFGVCPLVSAIPENKDVVGENGVTFQTGNTDHLSDQLQELIDHPNRASRLGLNAREAVRREYSWDRDVDEIEQVYLNLLQ